MLALFAAGPGDLQLLYSTQAILPELRPRLRGLLDGGDADPLAVGGHGRLALALLVAGPAVRRGRPHPADPPLAAALGRAARSPARSPRRGPRSSCCAVLQGVALAGLPAVATAYLREELHSSTQARAAGLYIGGTALGGMVGRLATGPVGEARRLALGARDRGPRRRRVRRRRTAAAAPPRATSSPAPTGGRAALATGRRALSDPALARPLRHRRLRGRRLRDVFNALGFRVAGPPFHLGLGAASLVFLVYPVGTLSARPSRVGWRTGSGAARSSRSARCWPWPASY